MQNFNNSLDNNSTAKDQSQHCQKCAISNKKVSRITTAAVAALLSFSVGVGIYSMVPKQHALSETKTCNIEQLPPSPTIALPLEIKEEVVPAVPLNISMSEGKIRSAASVTEVPAYPSIAKAAKVEGDVVVEISIDQDGNVTSGHIVSGHPLLQQAALSAAKRWKFDREKLSNTNANINGVLSFRFVL